MENNFTTIPEDEVLMKEEEEELEDGILGTRPSLTQNILEDNELKMGCFIGTISSIKQKIKDKIDNSKCFFFYVIIFSNITSWNKFSSNVLFCANFKFEFRS